MSSRTTTPPTGADPLFQVTASPAATSTKGTRIPDGFGDRLLADADFRGWARENCPAITEDLRFHLAQFDDYWHAASGRNATKRDWRRAAQVWMRTEQQRAGQRGRPAANGHRPAPLPDDHSKYDRRVTDAR